MVPVMHLLSDVCCIRVLLRSSTLVWVSVTEGPATVFFVNYSYIEKQVLTASCGFCFLVVLFVSESDIVSKIKQRSVQKENQ